MTKLTTRKLVSGTVLCALGAVSWLAAASASAAMHATDEFVAGTTRPVTIALLPAHVELVKQRMIRREAEISEGGELEAHVEAAVTAELEKRGYRVRAVTPEMINADPELQEYVVDADRRYTEMLTQVATRLPRQIAQRRYNAGDEMKLLAAKLGVDAMAFIRMDIIAAAKGVQVLNMGMNGAQTMLSVSLIDGTTSDIEAYLVLPILKRGKMFGGYEDIMKDPGPEMARFAELTLEELPAADASLRAERQSGDDVVGDLEALLDE